MSRARGLPGTLLAGLLSALALLGAACAEQAPPGGSLRVAAASSLRDVLQAALADFGPEVTVSYGPSSTLSRQIAEGADVDVFLSADAPCVERLGGLVDGSSTRVFLSNRLVLAGRVGLVDPPRTPAELVGRPLSIAVAGEAVPSGRYARQALERLGILDELESSFVGARDVRSALALVESAATDCAFVYASDLRAATHATLLWTAPEELELDIAYVGAALAQSRNPWADAFLDWLGGEGFRRAAAAHGFLVAAEARGR